MIYPNVVCDHITSNECLLPRRGKVIMIGATA
jgi:hypothetical protein